jgi:hypothetical protein
MEVSAWRKRRRRAVEEGSSGTASSAASLETCSSKFTVDDEEAAVCSETMHDPSTPRHIRVGRGAAAAADNADEDDDDDGASAATGTGFQPQIWPFVNVSARLSWSPAGKAIEPRLSRRAGFKRAEAAAAAAVAILDFVAVFDKTTSADNMTPFLSPAVSVSTP